MASFVVPPGSTGVTTGARAHGRGRARGENEQEQEDQRSALMGQGHTHAFFRTIKITLKVVVLEIVSTTTPIHSNYTCSSVVFRVLLRYSLH